MVADPAKNWHVLPDHRKILGLHGRMKGGGRVWRVALLFSKNLAK